MRQSLQAYVNKAVHPAGIEEALTRITGTGVIRSANYAIIDKEGVPGLQVIEHDKVYTPPFPTLPSI